MLKNQKGFTLIEMLFVLMIISILIILIVPNLSTKSEEVYSEGCEALVAVVQTQVDSYYLDNGSYPVSLDTLETDKYITSSQQTCKNGKVIPYTPSTGEVSKP